MHVFYNSLVFHIQASSMAEKEADFAMVGVGVALIVVFLVSVVLLGIKELISCVRRRKVREFVSEEEIISTAVGGGNSEKVSTENEINDDKKILNWADEGTIKALVSVLPRELKVPQNTCLKKLKKKQKKMYSCVVDSVIAVNQAILLNQGGTQFYESTNSSARAVIEVVKKVLAYRLRNEFDFTERERNKVWKVLLQHFPEAFKPKGTNKASIKPVMDALAQGQPVEVIFTATCWKPACKKLIGTYRYKFMEAPCAKSLNPIRGRIANLDEKLTEIIEKSLKQISLPNAKKIRCIECKTFGARVSPITSSFLKIPNVLILEFEKGDGNQERYPVMLNEEISINDERIYKLVSVVIHKPDHFLSISRVGQYWFNFDDLQVGPAQPFESMYSAVTLEHHPKEKLYQLNNRKETRGNAILFAVYTSDNGFIGDDFQENIEAPSLPSIDEDSIEEIEEISDCPNLLPSIAPQVVDEERNLEYVNRSTPKKRMMDRYIESTPKKRRIDRYFNEIAETRNRDPNILSTSENPPLFNELLTSFERDFSESVIVMEVTYGPEQFKYIPEVVNRKEKPPIVLFKGDEEVKKRYLTTFNDFNMDKNFCKWAEHRKHSKLGDHTGIKVSPYYRKVTLKDVLKLQGPNEFTVVSGVPFSELGEKPSPFENEFYDPSNSILSNVGNFGQCYGITEPTTEVSSEGSKLAMRTEHNYAQLINFNHGPGAKLWVVVESKFTLRAGEILEERKFKNFNGACCWTFCHRDVIFDLEKANIPFMEIVQHPGDTVYLPPGVLHMVTNISANMSESLNIIMEKDLPICRSYKVCQTHQEHVQYAGSQEMNNLFEKFKTNTIENFIYFADPQRDRKLRALEQLRNSGDQEREALLLNLENSYVVNHKVPEILEAFEEGRFMFQDAVAGVGSTRNVGTEPERNLTETSLNAEEDEFPENVHTFSSSGHEIRSAMVYQPLNFQSFGEEVETPSNQGVTESFPDRGTDIEQLESENEVALEHDPANLELGGNEAENSDIDNEEQLRIRVDGQNIMKSSEKQQFICLCSCQPAFTTKNFSYAKLHLFKKHQMKIIIPVEKCSLCGVENKSVFKNIHTCDVQPHIRTNMKWRESERYK